MIMFMVNLILVLIIVIFCFFVLMNQNLFLFSVKVFNSNFFGEFEILFNVWSMLFLTLVLIISLSVLNFSFSYMSGLKVNNFVFLYLSFIFSMMWLVMNNSFYWMMLGWDGLGVVSFLLIIFYMNYESIANGLFTLFQNRVGDLFFVLFLLGSSTTFMTTNLVVFWGLMCLIIGSIVKSAQFPFNSWLLSAMSAPTPISSLVHSSTLVVAGVFILLQYSYCLSDVLDFLKYISLLSLLISSFGLLNEADMKKLIAFSTMNHVSLMLYMMSFKLFKVTYFHLNIHAMFKSLMFMCFGFLMLCSFHAQDNRLVSLMSLNPLIKLIYYFSCLCLSGLPFLSGFFSKDLIIEKCMESSFELSFLFLLLCFLSISIYYSVKLMMLYKFMYSYNMIEKNMLGMVGIILMVVVMIMLINMYLSLMLSLSLEMISNKMFIYLLMLCFLFLSIMIKFNYKLMVYEKKLNLKEIWSLNFYMVDKFVYWNFFLFLQYTNSMANYKLILLMNWWVMIVFVMMF